MNPILEEFTTLIFDRMWPIVWLVIGINVVILVIRLVFKNALVRAAITIPLLFVFLYFAFGKLSAPVPGVSRSRSETTTRPLQQTGSNNAPKTIPSKDGGEVPAFTVE